MEERSLKRLKTNKYNNNNNNDKRRLEEAQSLLNQTSDEVILKLFKPHLFKFIEQESQNYNNPNFIFDLINQREKYYRWNDVNQDIMGLIGQFFDSSMYNQMNHINKYWNNKMRQFPHIWKNVTHSISLDENNNIEDFKKKYNKFLVSKSKSTISLISKLEFKITRFFYLYKVNLILDNFPDINQLTIILAFEDENEEGCLRMIETSNIFTSKISYISEVNIITNSRLTEKKASLLNTISSLHGLYLHYDIDKELKINYISLKKLRITCYMSFLDTYTSVIENCPNLTVIILDDMDIMNTRFLLNIQKIIFSICKLTHLNELNIHYISTQFDTNLFPGNIVYLFKNIPKTVTILSIEGNLQFAIEDLINNNEPSIILSNVKSLTLKSNYDCALIINYVYLMFPNLETFVSNILIDFKSARFNQLKQLTYLELKRWPKKLMSTDLYKKCVVKKICRDKNDIYNLLDLLYNGKKKTEEM